MSSWGRDRVLWNCQVEFLFIDKRSCDPTAVDRWIMLLPNAVMFTKPHDLWCRASSPKVGISETAPTQFPVSPFHNQNRSIRENFTPRRCCGLQP
jgi:hypothetical protein